MLREQAALRAGADAVISPVRRASFGELCGKASRIAGALSAREIGRGDRVGVLLGNGVEWLETAFGAMMAGAAVVPVSTWSTRDELAFLIGDSGVRLIFVAPRFGTRDFPGDLAEILKDASDAPEIVLTDGEARHGFTAMADFLSQAGDVAEDPRPEDDALILYTSGSTSAPKGVRLQHGAAFANAFHIGERQGLRPADRVFLPAPLFWSYGGVNALPAAFSHGAALVLCEKFDPAEAIATIERERCTAIYTLPSLTSALVRHPDFRPERVASLRTGLTIGSPDDFRLGVDRLGVPELCNIYGATETYGNCCVTPHEWPLERRAACQGPPLPGQELRFRDRETGEILPPGGTGLVEVRGAVSPGYIGASAALNASAFTEDGFYRTGDVGRLDESGAFVFVGRDTEMIKRVGINVSPAEVEDVLRLYPGVAACAVTGVPDPERGELIVAFVVPEPGYDVDPDALRRHCVERLSKYKLPDHVELCSDLPLTSTGKLQRKALRTLAADLVSARGSTPR